MPSVLVTELLGSFVREFIEQCLVCSRLRCVHCLPPPPEHNRRAIDTHNRSPGNIDTGNLDGTAIGLVEHCCNLAATDNTEQHAGTNAIVSGSATSGPDQVDLIDADIIPSRA